MTTPLPIIPEIELERLIGEGGMGRVFLGHQAYLDRPVAVKVMTITGSKMEEFNARFRREARILASLSHPHIVACYQAGSTPDGDCYLAMEFIDGSNLHAWIEEKGALDEAHALKVTRDVAQALEYALARGIIHRDVKPENILLQQAAAGGDGRFPFIAKLVDLGLARPAMDSEQPTRLTAKGIIMGTPATMAPEQYNDPDNVDFSADIYGLGCTLYYMLTGEPAFPQGKISELIVAKLQGEPPDPSRLVSRLRAPLVRLVRRMLSHNPLDRPRSYQEIIEACKRLMVDQVQTATTGQQIDTAPTRPFSISVVRGSDSESRRKSSLVIPAVALLVLMGAAYAVYSVGLGRFGSRDAPVSAEATLLEPAPVGDAPREVKEPLEVSFSEVAVPMLAQGFNRLEGWGASIGAAGWEPEDEGEGVNGFNGSGRKPYSLGSGPWRFEGVVDDVSNEGGMRVDLGNGQAMALIIQNIQSGLLYSLVPILSENPATGEFQRGAPIKSNSLKGASELRFVLEVIGRHLKVFVNDMVFAEAALSDDAVGISLYVAGTKARFRDLTYRKPASPP